MAVFIVAQAKSLGHRLSKFALINYSKFLLMSALKASRSASI
ncbi:hypothetical protein [Glaciecola petra]|uniref:Uncharacterized protein n=1 Tax=Glaciecola petra TaxID=3075602 RepID=A0ABU2ZQL5_9ALTE|nr:hypothetical protein [Aestuariibacter sp. P117]MDT0594912.1 hypothetical protein [Aestuariibacter sp. P117]